MNIEDEIIFLESLKDRLLVHYNEYKNYHDNKKHMEVIRVVQRRINLLMLSNKGLKRL